MNEIITKLMELQNNTQPNWTSFPSMLEDLARFHRDLPALIDKLHDEKRFFDELEKENIELRRQLRGELKHTA